jgi:hydroxymethylglutaryl-CoA lyase
MGADRFVIVNDVGPRDGLQNQPVQVPAAGKLKLIQHLLTAGLKHIEVTSFVSPKVVPQMADAAEVYAGLPAAADVEYSALIPNEKGYERARAAGARSVAVVLSATETMNQKNISMSLEKARSVSHAVVARARAEGIKSRAYIAVAFECPYEGPVDAERVRLLAADLFEKGADEVIIADTIGAANPGAVMRLFQRLGREFGVERLSAHFHDTRALALANAWAALEAGIRKFDASIGGLGGCPFAPGASGNVATEDLVMMLHQCGYTTGIDVDKLCDAVAVAADLIKAPLGGRMLPWLRAKQARAAAKTASA